MRKATYIKFFVAVFAVIFLVGTIDTFSQRKPRIRRTKRTKVNRNNYQVATGTKIRVRLENEINSKSSQVGDNFNTNVTEPVYSNTGVIVIPNGSKVIGRIDAVQKAEKGGKPGTISVSFIQVRLPNGTKRAINGSLTSLDSKNAKSDNEGTASADKMKNRKIIFIGGGAGGGAILGGIIGGGKGAVIGGILGGAGGLLGERFSKGKEAKVKSNTEFGVFVNQNFSLPRYSANDPVRNDGGDEGDDTRTPPTGGGQTYVVQPGDTLGKISIKFYGTASRYMDIYNANRAVLSSPNSVSVGQRLVIP